MKKILNVLITFFVFIGIAAADPSKKPSVIAPQTAQKISTSQFTVLAKGQRCVMGKRMLVRCTLY